MLKRVLITRESGRATKLIRLLEDAGMNVIAEPATRTIFPDDVEPIDPGAVDWIVFTSVNGVTGFMRQYSKASIPNSSGIAVIGEATGEAAKSMIRNPDLIASKANGGGLAEELIAAAGARILRILWPCSEKPRAALSKMLREAGFDLTQLPVYRTEAIPAPELRSRLERHSPWDAAVFAAPSAVKSFSQAWPTMRNFACIAIGETTGEALRATGYPIIYVSESPQPEAVAAEIRNSLTKILS